jgi:hypothetical protein
MNRTYELWDTSTSNLVAAHGSEAEALAFVRAYADEHGTAYPASWVLLWDDDDTDDAGQIAEGYSLLSLAGVITTPEATEEAARRRAG